MSVKLDYSGSNSIIIGGVGGTTKVGINIDPTDGYLKIPAGTTATPPIKFSTGTNLSTPVNGAMEYDGYHLYITTGGVRTQADGSSSSVGPSPSANWWAGNTCTDWSKTQTVINRSIGAGSGPRQVVAYTGVNTSPAYYEGGTLGPNGNVYLTPYMQSGSTGSTWHYIRTSDNTVQTYTGVLTTTDRAYNGGGALAANGNIYLAPNKQSTTTPWHYIRTSDNTVQIYTGNPSGISSGAYSGAIYAPNGNIYFMPYGQSNQAVYHYVRTSDNLVQSYSNSQITIQYAYIGGVLAPNGNIYLCPYIQSNQSTWHYIDTNTATPTVVGYTPGITGTISTNAYNGGTLAPNGKIYMVPASQATQTTNWHYIDTQCNLPFPLSVCTNPMFNKF